MSNLRKYRESPSTSQTALAKAVGCTQGAIRHWESGHRFPDLETCRALVTCPNKLGTKVSLDGVFPLEHKTTQQADPLFATTDIRPTSLKSEFQDI